MDRYDVVIVGTGHAGAHAAITLRHLDFAGSIAMIGRDPDAPYERPPLSKDYLAREKAFERIYIRPPAFWAEQDIVLRSGIAVVSVDPVARTVGLSDGGTCGYGQLIWAAGGDARALTCPGATIAGVHSVRDRGDVDRIMAELDRGAQRVVVIGGGYIGLEAASVLRKLDRQVILVEALPRILARVAGPELSDFFQAEHRAHGVDLRLDTAVACIEGDGTRATGVRLQSDEVIPADMVIVGIGIIASVEPLRAAGATGSNGVEVDEYGRTSLPDVYAIGDCAAQANHWADGTWMRVESVQNAHAMAAAAAKSICETPEANVALPWFWSNQYDLKLQTAGLSIGYDRTVLRGSTADRKFSIAYLKDARVVAIDCVNNPRDYVQGQKLIQSRRPVDPIDLADPTRTLASLCP